MINESITCGIVIPIYNFLPKLSEAASLKQLLKILPNNKIYFICGVDFDPFHYISLVNKYSQALFIIERFNNSFFSSINGYNSLMMSKKFYQRFKSLDYILIYQLDAWIFKNELNYWCIQNYDYIGAPWLYESDKGNLIFNGVGNGGLSLRKVKSHLRILNSFSFIKKPGYLWYIFNREPSLKSFINFIAALTIRNNTFHLSNDFSANEDVFWGNVASKNFSWFSIPNEQTALKFSIEMYASQLIKKAEDLPFGCHAWERYEPDFWKRFIK